MSSKGSQRLHPSRVLALRARDALIAFLDELGRYQTTREPYVYGLPIEPSLACNELRHPSLATYLRNRHSMLNLLIENGYEHAEMLARTAHEPVLPLAMWSAFRGTLEHTSWFLWLLCRNESPEERARRSILMQLEDLRQQRSFLNEGKQPDPEQVATINAEIAKRERQATRSGFAVTRTKSGQLLLDGEALPKSTALAGAMLRKKASYRLASGVFHGRAYAVLRGFKPHHEDNDYTFMEKTGSDEMFALLLDFVTWLIMRMQLDKYRLFGWPNAPLLEAWKLVLPVRRDIARAAARP